MLKTPIFRSRKLLDLAKKVPHCFECLAPNEGQIVACHSGQGRDGKVIGLKAQDYRIAYLCGTCHFKMDSGKDLTRIQKTEMFERNHRLSIGWLFESGNVGVLK